MQQPTGQQRCVREISANPTEGSKWNIALGPPDPGRWGWIRAFRKKKCFFPQHLKPFCFSVYLKVFIFLCLRTTKTPWHTFSHISLLIIKLRGHKVMERRKFRKAHKLPLIYFSFMIILYIFVLNIVVDSKQRQTSWKDQRCFMNLVDPQNADNTCIYNFQIKHDVIMNLFSFTLRLTEMSCI